MSDLKTARSSPADSPPLREADARLKPYLDAASEPEIRRELARLMSEAEPVIRGIIRRRWGVSGDGGGSRQSREGQIAEDVRGEVTVSLLTRLHQLKENPGATAIGDFRSFVAVTTYHVCDNHLRKKYPLRASLKNKLLYLFGQRSGQTGLAVWDGAEGDRLCGFAKWQEQRKPITRNSRYVELVSRPQSFADAALARESVAHMNPADLVARIFNWVGSPIELDDMVNAVAHLWGIRDQTPEESAPAARDEDETERMAQVPDPQANVATEVAQRAFLKQLWSEISQLPPRQCAALLLNLRDPQGRGVIALLPLEGIATMRQMAQAMEMSPERFAELWDDLPLEDLAIAELLGVTRQQVINLRKVARERLARRMKALTEAV